jgi:UDP-N-acetylmuramoylalanine-D-glutamate ligase
MNNNTKIILGLGVTGVIAYLILKPKSLPVKVNKTSEEDYKNANAKIAKKII